MSTAIFAQKTVTFDFDNDYQKLFPTLKGVSSGSGDSYVADGDFTEPTTSTQIDGVDVRVAPVEDAKTPSRIWKSSPRLRMYSGVFTVTSLEGPITKIEFTGHDTNFNLMAVPADECTLDGKVWTGSTSCATFLVVSNTQISKIVVTLGGGSETPDNPDDPTYKSDMKYTWGEVIENDNELVFNFKGVINEVGAQKNIEVTGKMVMGFDKDLCTSASISVTYPSAELAQIAYQESLEDATEEEKQTITISGNTVTATDMDFLGYSKIVIKSMLYYFLYEDIGGMGTKESPMTPIQANIAAGTIEKDAVSEQDFYIKGKIASIKFSFSAQYGTATFFIAEEGKEDVTFQCYSVYYLENKPWVEGNTQIKEGDEVIICGKVTNYKGTTPETASKQAYIYSLNGNTKNEFSDDPQPVEVKEVSIAEFNEAPESNDVWYQLTGVVKNLKDGDQYGNFDLEDATGSVYVYGLLSEKGGEKKKFQELAADKGIVNGSTLVIIGNRGSYKDKIEVTNAYFVAILGSDVKGDANGDGVVNAADIVEVVNYIMGNPSDKFNVAAADVNGDNVVNAADIVSIVNIIMGVN